MPSTTPLDPMARMRAHKGNAPSLPQTKYCSLCPAKFTRTTHLNRHLRSHNDDRLYRCDLCEKSEFTRSDLLIRHMRTCGQRSDRFRKRACEACAESKIKCSLQYPCAKCTSRGRQCVFTKHLDGSRNQNFNGPDKSASPIRSTTSQAPSSLPLFPELTSPAPDDCSRKISSSPHSPGLPELSESGTSSGASSIHSSPRSEHLETFDKPPFELLCDFEPPEDPVFSLDQCLFPRVFSPVPLPPPTPPSNLGDFRMPTVILDYVDPLYMQRLFGAPAAMADMYLHCFFTRFLVQIPLIHLPTWKMADTPPSLTRIFHACGALFVNTPEATAFVQSTVSSVTAHIIAEFMSITETINPDSDVPLDQIYLIIGLVLLQIISVLQSAGERPAIPNPHHHSMLVMIRRTGLIQRVTSWKGPDWTDSIPVGAAWTEWTQFETVKRALLLAYFHDCCHCIYSAAAPAFSPAEGDLPLPCDEALWRAPSAVEWFSAAHMPSPYGVGIARVYGVGTHKALMALIISPTANPAAAIDTSAAGLPITSFGLFVLIHIILRSISLAQRSPSPNHDPEAMFQTQMMLDNWLKIWLNSAEAALSEGVAQRPPFVCDSMPLYWLAQVSLWESSWSGPAFIDQGGSTGLFHPQPASV
ncbi:fungal-specific transcription factor domain-containing protein [Mycena albidolilacea]|uniref:Fungal-specific transcription factor domain-containing protein n=1 Tax=Mycena albidolilacea TaxID=1033008 RepID=A0AAD6YXY5_9AGAR|nr:fungal-specific transcription factor domain-containing protein [Mycena albidolilacea]